MEDQGYVRELGSESKVKFENDIDTYIDLYQGKAKELGYDGELKFRVKKGKVIIFVEI